MCTKIELITGKIEKTDWNVNALEKKIEENKFGKGMTSSAAKVPKWNRQQFDDKVLWVKCAFLF